MVARTLVTEDIDAGRQLVESLDRRGTQVRAAFWWHDPENDRWKLVLALDEYSTRGPLEAYGIISDAMPADPDGRLALDDIRATRPDDAVVRALGRLVRTGKSLQGVRISNSWVNHIEIDDAYVYRVNLN